MHSPSTPARPEHTTPTIPTHERARPTMTEKQTPPESFLAAVATLRADEDTVRATAHTSSVSADGWTATEPTFAPVGTDA